MWEILEVLRRVGRGESKSAVARTTGHSRVTIRRYVRTAAELGWDPGVEEPSEELAAGVYARHRPASERKPGGPGSTTSPAALGRCRGEAGPRGNGTAANRITQAL